MVSVGKNQALTESCWGILIISMNMNKVIQVHSTIMLKFLPSVSLNWPIECAAYVRTNVHTKRHISFTISVPLH